MTYQGYVDDDSKVSVLKSLEYFYISVEAAPHNWTPQAQIGSLNNIVSSF